MKYRYRVIAAAFAIGAILGCGPFLSHLGAMGTAPEEVTTEAGTPRSETLVIELGGGRVANPTQTNPYMPGTPLTHGYHQLNISHLWDVDTVTGEQFPAVAAEPAEPLGDDHRQWRIHLRQGLHWSDGVEFTADDVEFTISMLLETPALPYSGVLSGIVEEVSIVDRYTVDITTVNPEPRIQKKLGAFIWGSNFRLLPKHVWEGEDPATFNDFPPVGLGPYVLVDHDPQGYWFLWQRREDWERSDVGMISGEPGPEYILYQYFGTDEKRILSGASNEIDIFLDLSPDSFELLKQRNPNVRAWYDHFPYANMDDPAQRGIYFVTVTPPYDSPQVRWALTLATNIDQVALSSYDGMLRVSPIHLPPVAALMDAYHMPLESWMKEFTLADGYQPYDPGYAVRMGQEFRDRGMTELPTSEGELKEIFGVGWWRYDPQKAEQLLEEEGFSRDSNGQWRLPGGERWQMNIVAPAGFEPQAERLAFAVAEEWRRFGVDATVVQKEGAGFAADYFSGAFGVGSYWSMSLGLGPDVYDVMEPWHKRFVVPVGEHAAANQVRFANDEISRLLDEMSVLTSDDPRVIELTREMLKEFVREMPYIPMFGTSKFVPVNTYYWDGFPTADNHYEGPWWWWSNFKYTLPNLVRER